MARTHASRVIAFTLALGASLSVANAETPEQIQALDREWAQACVQADLAKLEQILSDDLTYTHSSGQVQTKPEFIRPSAKERPAIGLSSSSNRASVSTGTPPLAITRCA